MEMRCYRKILRISCKDHVTNEEACAKVQIDLLTIVKSEVVRTCLSFIWSGQNHLARHSERGKSTMQTEEKVGRQHQEMDRPGIRQIPEGSGEQENGENWL